MSESSSTPSNPGSHLEERIGRAIAARLSEGTAALPHDLGERLRVARTQALARQKREPRSFVALDASGQATAGAGVAGWRAWLASALPLVALVAGLALIAQWQAGERAAELAEIDAALLTDDLPTAAYVDPGFAQFLKANSAQP